MAAPPETKLGVPFAYDVGRWVMKLPTSDASETPIVQHMRSPQRVDAILDRKVPVSPRDVN